MTMVDLKKKIQELKEKNDNFKREFAQAKNVDESEKVSFYNIELHPYMQFSVFDNNEIRLFHTIVHNIFALDKSKSDLLKTIHGHIVSEMEGRSINHFKFDRLDDI